VLAGCLVALGACGKESNQGGTGGTVVLKVNDRAFTTADMEKEMAQEMRRMPRELLPLLASKEGQRQFLDRLQRRELLLQEAEKRKLGDKPEIADQVAAMRRDLVMRALVQEEIGGKIAVDEKDAEAYYKAHPDEFSGDTLKLKHILAASEGEAKEVLERLAKNEPFEKVARAMSQDPGSAARGGELDYMGREQMVPEIANAAFSLKPGEVSGIVKSPFGFHVLKLVDRKKGTPATFEQVKGQLHRRLLEDRQAQRFQAWVKELEAAAKITRNDGLLPIGTFGAPPAGPTAPVAPPAKVEGKS
jgi:peptidyl-prolyl cis-trans isomerase C